MLRFIFILAIGGCAWPALAAERMFDFSTNTVNAPPEGFRSVRTGGGSQPGDWRVILAEPPSLFAPISPKSPEVRQRPTLAQLSRERNDDKFMLLVLEQEKFEDFTLTTFCKIVDGDLEQMAGIAFRIQDEKNYYYIRADARGTNLAFCKVVNGQVVERKSTSQRIAKGVWFELAVDCKGNQFRGLLNGREAVLVTDVSGKQAFESGQIGFWTKSDSVCYFADARLKYRVREPFAQTLVKEVRLKYPRLQGMKIFAALEGHSEPTVIASLDGKEVGETAKMVEKDVIERGTVYYGKDKDKGTVIVTLPLHDKNGESIAAVKIVMKSFPGQTEQNALVRAMPIVKQLEARVPTLKDLAE